MSKKALKPSKDTVDWIFGIDKKENGNIRYLETLKNDGLYLQFINEQTEEICLTAVKQNGLAIRYVKKQTEEICLEAVKQYGLALQYVENKTPEICFYAYLNRNDILGESFIEDEIRAKKIGLKNFITEKEIEFMDKYDFYQADKRTVITSDGRIYEGNIDSFISMDMDKNFTLKIKREFINKYNLIENNIISSEDDDFINDYGLIDNNIVNEIKRSIEKTYRLKSGDIVRNLVNEFIYDNKNIRNQVFCCRGYGKKDNWYYIDMKSLDKLKEYLLKNNSNNKYILSDDTDIEILKEVAISNNELVLIDNGNITDIHKLVANDIIDKETFLNQL